MTIFLQEPRDLSIQDAALRMQAGALTAVRLVESCLERIRAHEATLRAWVVVRRDEAELGRTGERRTKSGGLSHSLR